MTQWWTPEDRNTIRKHTIGLMGAEDAILTDLAPVIERIRADADEAQTRLDRVRALHRRRSWDLLRDMGIFGQTEWPDRCDHCRVNWPCETAAILEAGAREDGDGMHPEASDQPAPGTALVEAVHAEATRDVQASGKTTRTRTRTGDGGGTPFARMLRDGGSPRIGSWEAAERALDDAGL